MNLPQILSLPISKMDIHNKAAQFVKLILDSGEVNPCDVAIRLSALDEFCSEVRKNNLFVASVEKHCSEQESFSGAKIRVGQRSLYDYSECNCSALTDLEKEIKEKTEELKKLQKQLQSIDNEFTVIDKESGEMFNAPIKTYSAKSITVTLQK